MSKKKKDLTTFIEAGKKNLEKWKRENPAGGNLTHGIYSKTIRKRYSDLRTLEGKALHSIMKGIEKDIGKPFDARQSILMSLIRSKVVIMMSIGKYLESCQQIIDYEQGTIPHVIDKTFFSCSASLRSALNELYTGRNAKQRGQKTYEQIVDEMKKASSAARDRGEGPPPAEGTQQGGVGASKAAGVPSSCHRLNNVPNHTQAFGVILGMISLSCL